MAYASNREFALRMSVFYIWVITLGIAILVFLLLLEWRGMSLSDIQGGFGHLMEIITPQVAIMTAFLFRSSKENRLKLVETDGSLAIAAIVLSAMYHLVLIVCLILGVLLGKFGQGFDDNMDVALAVSGYLSVIGTAPVAYLFGRSKED